MAGTKTEVRRRFMRGNVFAIVLVAAGALLLLANLGLLHFDLAEIARTWWPVVLILLGVGLFFTPPDSKK
jgi:hypothetical protein